ncbi:amidohydrolase family protein [Pedobacter sp. AW1-32]|uniref:amidohydrolase family protein n=1 Tax=Pedobacter sp. AW1-32 TaxID=3383026 RepID=UPI003FEE5E45
MLRYISADWIFPVRTSPIQNGVIAVDSEGVIKEVLTEDEAFALDLDIQKHSGAIVPGFVNTHCHLELSHMLHKIPEHTGLVEFVQQIIKNRQSETDEVLQAMQLADTKMAENGIVAVGDISNQIVSRQIKLSSKIYYHTFVEAMGFNPDRADAIMDFALSTKKQFAPLPAAVVPHAPYSVSVPLLQKIANVARQGNEIISIHNQETNDENDFFLSKTGGFLKLYDFLGLDISFFTPSGKTSLQTWLPNIPNQKILMVHNTVTAKEDLEFAAQNKQQLYWCLCPQANLYIENCLPDVDLMRKEKLKITLGTDSLASNSQLNILAEMQTLQVHKKIPFTDLLQWATWNGAEFLEKDDVFGSIEIGKKPGLNLIQLSDDFTIVGDLVEKLC